MNIIIANEKYRDIQLLKIATFKSYTGVFSVNDIVNSFKSFVFDKMILDVTALDDYRNVNVYQVLAKNFKTDKIILFIPEETQLCTASFLAQLVDFGLYNFTTNLEGIKYLLSNSNELSDVSQFKDLALKSSLADSTLVLNSSNKKTCVVGFKDITDDAGATTLIYMLKKELDLALDKKVIAVEIDKNDFPLFNEKNMLSIKRLDLPKTIYQHNDAPFILVDLNTYPHDDVCDKVFYLLEPSIIKLNKVVRREPNLLRRIKDKNVILNKSLLSDKDVNDFEFETGVKVKFNMPPLDERKWNRAINDFLVKFDFIMKDSGESSDDSDKIFGLFRK